MSNRKISRTKSNHYYRPIYAFLLTRTLSKAVYKQGEATLQRRTITERSIQLKKITLYCIEKLLVFDSKNSRAYDNPLIHPTQVDATASLQRIEGSTISFQPDNLSHALNIN